jgi:hypothetical protein
MVYQPMLELLAYLRANGFKTFIVSGGGIEFMRPWVERVYGIPPEQVVGSSGGLKFELRDGAPVMSSCRDRVHRRQGGQAGRHPAHIGRRPIAAFGNSDGDLQMLQWTAAGAGARFGLIVHHTDAEREWAYDRASHIGRSTRRSTRPRARGWTVVDMKNDWRPRQLRRRAVPICRRRVAVLPPRRAVLRPHRRRGRPPRRLRGPYTFGVEPLQQYLVEFPDGRLQALSIAWDTRAKAQGGQRWFHLYPDERVDHRDELHWTRARRTGTSCARTATPPTSARTTTPRRHVPYRIRRDLGRLRGLPRAGLRARRVGARLGARTRPVG